MICPHCQTNLKQKERPGRRCSKCKRVFALDPKGNPLQLHDVRLRRLIERLSEGGLYYTTTQLWYAAARKTLRADARLISVLTTIRSMLRLTGMTRKRATVKMNLREFRDQVIDRWATVYGAELPGLVRESLVGVAKSPLQPALAVLCPDPSVLICLQVNQVPQRLHLALAQRVEDVPPGVPVAILHDASCAGYVFAAQARGSLGGRQVVDVGLRPSTVMNAKGAVRLRDAPPPTEMITWLRTAGLLTDAEINWLATGWWSPAVAIRPKALLARIDAVAGRLPDPDPDRRAASAVGFMTWPGR